MPFGLKSHKPHLKTIKLQVLSTESTRKEITAKDIGEEKVREESEGAHPPLTSSLHGGHETI